MESFTQHDLISFLSLIFVMCIYFLPTLVAAGFKHRHDKAIFALNLIFGFTVIGWIVALIWSLCHQPRQIARY